MPTKKGKRKPIRAYAVVALDGTIFFGEEAKIFRTRAEAHGRWAHPVREILITEVQPKRGRK